MDIRDNRIDAGKAFDWGKTSENYARYRDIYPEEFYRRVADRGLCVAGQKVLDLGTGTGVLPRNMYGYGAEWIPEPNAVIEIKDMLSCVKEFLNSFERPSCICWQDL